MSSEKFENLEDDLSTAIGELRSAIEKISSLNGGIRYTIIQTGFENVLEEIVFGH